MNTQTQQQTRYEDKGGFTAESAETAVGSEMLESFFSAAVGSAIGAPLPEIPGPMDVGHVVDIVDEVHKEKQDQNFVLGQKNAIAQEFNFGGMNQDFSKETTGPGYGEAKPNQDLGNDGYQEWRAKPNMIEELANVRVPSIPANESAFRSSLF